MIKIEMFIFLNNTRNAKKQNYLKIALPLIRFFSHGLRTNNEYLHISIEFF